MRIAPGPLIKAIAAVNLLIAAIMLIPSLWEPMMVAGALFPARFTAGDAAFQGYFLLPAWLTPVSAAFLHGGILHVGLNMLMLLMIGPNLERVLGWRAVGVLYAAGIVLSAAAEIIAKPDGMTPIVGASGAISALIAAHAMLFPREIPKPIGPIPGRWAHALKLLAGWTVLNLMLGFVGPSLGVTLAIWAHVGGFAAGLLLTWPLLHWKYRQA